METLPVGRVRRLFKLMYAKQTKPYRGREVYATSPLFDLLIVVACLICAVLYCTI